MLIFKHPWHPAFMPLVPDASSGRRGVFNQISQAGNHLTRNVDVVVRQKDQMALEIAVLAQVDDVLDVLFPFVIAWMRFAREHELDGAVFVARSPHDILKLLEDQRARL
jgi:hypothetical protein